VVTPARSSSYRSIAKQARCRHGGDHNIKCSTTSCASGRDGSSARARPARRRAFARDAVAAGMLGRDMKVIHVGAVIRSGCDSVTGTRFYPLEMTHLDINIGAHHDAECEPPSPSTMTSPIS